MEKEMTDIVETLRHLVSLNEPDKGGPYQGFAAASCVKAMRDAADEIVRLRTESIAIAIIEARLPLYTDIGQINALRECISSIKGALKEHDGA